MRKRRIRSFRPQRPIPTALTKVLYRAPYSDKWEEKSWDWAITEIAKRVKATRDATFVEKNDKGQVVNRVETIAHLGSSNIDNEEICGPQCDGAGTGRWFTSTTRPGSDTAQLLRLWESRSGAAQ